jgi:ERF superfamily
MSVYKKLQQARANLCALPLKKSGINKFAGYQYFELADFLPEIQQIFSTVGLCGVTDFSGDTRAALHVHETDGDGCVSFYSPLADATVKGATAIQIVGSQITYLRRYLWMQALEITDNDLVDSQPPGEQKQQYQPKPSQPSVDYKTKLESAKTLKELGEIWQNIPKPQQAGLKEVKDNMKAKLTTSPNWQQLINDAQSKEELQAVVDSLPDSVKEELNDAIVLKQDLFRSGL